MNKNFIMKMIKAKQLEYEAVKELMPECIRGQWEESESKIKDQIKEIAIEIIKEEMAGDKEASINRENTQYKEETQCKEMASKVKKVKVEF